VASRRALDHRPRAAVPQRLLERLVGIEERIVLTRVEPDPEAGVGARVAAARDLDHVVALEVLGVVEGPVGGLAGRLPDRRRVAADGAEHAGAHARDVVGAEAAHRDTPDCDPVWVDVVAVGDLRDRVEEDV
jgi:hypothetical protein